MIKMYFSRWTLLIVIVVVAASLLLFNKLKVDQGIRWDPKAQNQSEVATRHPPSTSPSLQDYAGTPRPLTKLKLQRSILHQALIRPGLHQNSKASTDLKSSQGGRTLNFLPPGLRQDPKCHDNKAAIAAFSFAQGYAGPPKSCPKILSADLVPTQVRAGG